MNKKEFLDALGSRLRQQMSQEQVRDQIRYYDNYLNERMSQGLSEREAVAELGDPLLIAKTIMDTREPGADSNRVYANESGSSQGERSKSSVGSWFSRYKYVIITVAVILIACIAVFHVAAVVIRVVAPILIPVLVIIMAVRLIRKKR